ncbi:MAG: NADH-quinone oxidoreductase subunit L [Silicimonas sp.]|nr:NADH-quinone oxidoreductase subunit L [Silicimonas sp.]
MYSAIIFLPLLGAMAAGLFGRWMGDRAARWVTTGALLLAAVLAAVAFVQVALGGQPRTVEIMRWVVSGNFEVTWALRYDTLSAVMVAMVTAVSSMIHLYSFGYMAHDKSIPRFFAYLSLFTFFMLMLVTADNFLQMFFGWEGVGLASYLLIGFYFRKPSANAAAIKAFIVNRVGDFGFALGILALFLLVDSVNFTDIFAAAPALAETEIHFLWTNWNAAELVAFLLFVGAMGKSAQLFLHTWLPDAMEGPTPVSALIHAATMVTAGVFLVCRMSPVMEFAPATTTFIVVIGASTAFFAATVGLVQNDIKRVIAYSTCSQLGYMFVAAGVGVYSVAMFHLFTHAFFKAMLFLGAGSIIHGMHHEQDMRNYGGLKDKMPYTFWAMMIGTLAITGVGIPLLYIGFPVGFAGFVSKDAIIESAYAGGTPAATFAFWALVLAALMTSFYSWRLMFMTFYGEPRGDKHTHEHAHESPTTMLAPLGVLAVGAILAGMIWYKPFFGDHHAVENWFGIAKHEKEAALVLPGAAFAATEEASDDHADDGEGGDQGAGPVPGQGAIFMAADNHVLDNAHHVPVWVKLSPFLAMLIGFGVAFLFYIRRPDLPAKLAENQAPLYRFLFNKWYFDEIYDFLFVRPAKAIGRFLWKKGDGATIDGFLNGLAMGVVPFFTRLAGRAQSGYIFTYAFWMVLGILVLITWMTLSGGAE